MKGLLEAATAVFILGAVATGLVGFFAAGIAAVTVVPVGVAAVIFKVFGL